MGMMERATEWLTDSDVVGVIVTSVLASLIAAGLIAVTKKTGHLPGRLGKAGRRLVGRDRTSVALNAYLEQVAKQAFDIRHPWMRETQTLSDIWVPATVSSDDDHAVALQDVRQLLTRQSPHDPRRTLLAVIGAPGSGKSVALRSLARSLAAGPTPSRVPILFTFADYRDAGYTVTTAAGRVLCRHGFDTETAADFVTSGLEDGHLVVLIDALDELDTEHRNKAARALSSELRQHTNLSAVLSCRSAVWRDQVDLPGLDVVRIADFNDASIRQFVGRWHFDPPKSSVELQSILKEVDHLADLGRNPLMLTIIAFLYGQPKYRLPDNRAQFYEICTRALLEEWDHATSAGRANKYDRPHKERLLSLLAFEHMKGPDPDQDIDEELALDLVGNSMEQDLGLRRADNAQMLNEMVERSGLLLRLPPSGLRYPHQTFLEFFAATWMLRGHDAADVLRLYAQDPERWRETLLLWCGLSTADEAVATILDSLVDEDAVPLALRAMADARVVSPETASRVLDAAEQDLLDHPSKELIDGIGAIAANDRTSYCEVARDLLHGVLVEATASGDRQMQEETLMAAVRAHDPRIPKFIADNAQRLHLGHLLVELGDRASLISDSLLFADDLAESVKLGWIDGLADAGTVAVLFGVVTNPNAQQTVRERAALGLVVNSGLDAFWEIAQRTDPAEVVGARPTDSRWSKLEFRDEEPTPEVNNVVVAICREAAAQLDHPAELERVATVDCNRAVLGTAIGMADRAGYGRGRWRLALPNGEFHRVARWGTRAQWAQSWTVEDGRGLVTWWVALAPAVLVIAADWACAVVLPWTYELGLPFWQELAALALVGTSTSLQSYRFDEAVSRDQVQRSGLAGAVSCLAGAGAATGLALTNSPGWIADVSFASTGLALLVAAVVNLVGAPLYYGTGPGYQTHNWMKSAYPPGLPFDRMD